MRVIAGRLRGRDLGTAGEGVRPTADRVRESLFSVLGPLASGRVLDLFAGTGALGIEAFSRGAGSVVWVERSRTVARALSERLARLGLGSEPGLQVLQLDALRALRRLEETGVAGFDLVFADPPYGDPVLEPVLTRLFQSACLAPDATVVVEGSRRHPLPPVPGARVVDERHYGDTVVTWLARAETVGGE